VIRDGETLISQIPIWEATLPKDKFERFLDEGAMFVSDWITARKESLGEVAATYCHASTATRDDWGPDERTPRSARDWGPLDQVAKDKDYNRVKSDNARKRVVDPWKQEQSRHAM
jgi:hypothetical protein